MNSSVGSVNVRQISSHSARQQGNFWKRSVTGHGQCSRGVLAVWKEHGFTQGHTRWGSSQRPAQEKGRVQVLSGRRHSRHRLWLCVGREVPVTCVIISALRYFPASVQRSCVTFTSGLRALKSVWGQAVAEWRCYWTCMGNVLGLHPRVSLSTSGMRACAHDLG